MSAAGGGYGVITNMYALVALILVLLTFGMETTFFRFANKEGENPQRVFSTALIGVSSAATLFVVLVLLFITPVSSFLGYADHPSYVWVMALTIGIDAIRAIPFVYLRQQKKAIKFASLQLLNIAINITLNLIYYKWFNVTDPGYAFYINLVTSTVVLLCLYKELFSIRHGFDPQLMRRMLSYSWPIVILGVAGILNQVADKILFPFVYKGSDMQMQLGIYGATVKIAMIMAMITHAFRYAYEPFVFGKTHDKDNDEMQATAMKYFLIFTLLAFLCVVGYIDVLKYIIGDDYWEGLRVIPIVMAAEIMMGVYFNLSFWYKLEDKTFWGAVFSTVGCGVLIAGNVLFVPRYGYMACAWSGFAGYATAMTLSYIVGRIYHPIAYPLRSIAIYVGMTLLFFVAMSYGREYLPLWASLGVNTVLVLLFCAYIVRYDMPLSSLPVIGKFFNKK
jgi:O-antigen/teichoic acid export membrane protein